MAGPKTVAVIMACGSGTRFWPLSQPTFPKQFLKLAGEKSLIAETAERIAPIVGGENIYVCSVEAQAPLLRRELPQVPNLILEPQGRNTAPCLMLTAYHLQRAGISDDTVLVVLPADHYIQDRPAFEKVIRAATELAREKDALVTLGILPTSPHTGYGYIETEGGAAPRKVKRFVEKPDRAKAESFLAAKTFFWNSGMFVWRLGTLVRAFEKYCTADWKTLCAEGPAAAYPKLTAAPIDTAVMEKADNLFLFPADIGWTDIGSWNAVYELRAKSTENVVLSGDVKNIRSQSCLVHLPAGKSVALVGVEDLIIVEKDGQLLIARRDQDQLVREAAKAFETRPNRS